MKQLERIEKMEAIFDKARANIGNLSRELETYQSLQKDLEKLIAYYEGRQWMKDFTDDQQGKIPADVKRGVLSEDGIYDMLIEEKEMINSMLDIIRGYLNK